MKKILILFLFPLMMFAQDTILIGDVDCSGEVNSQDASLILQFVTSVIDELPCEANMTGLTPEQLQEMIDVMEDQLSINYTTGSGGGCDVEYPDGYLGDNITHDLIDLYTVPSGKNLYVNLMSLDNNADVYIDDIRVNYGYSNYSSSNGYSCMLYLSEGQTISSSTSYSNTISFNGFLIDKKISPITYDLLENYIVPSGKNLYVNLMSLDNTADVYIDDIRVNYGYSNYSSSNGYSSMLYLSEGQTISSSTSYPNTISFNGYLADEDYFADCSGGEGSTINSVADIGGGDILYPDGYDGQIITWDLTSSNYIVPDGKNLYVNNLYSTGPYLMVDSMIVSYGRNNASWGLYSNDALNDGNTFSNPLCFNAGSELNFYTPYAGAFTEENLNFSGLLVEAQVNPITWSLKNSGSYTVPSGKKLIILNFYDPGNYLGPGGQVLSVCYGGIQVDNIPIFNDNSGGESFWGSSTYNFSQPIFVKNSSIVSLINDCSDDDDGYINNIVFNGYLVDEDYFSSSGENGDVLNNNSDNSQMSYEYIIHDIDNNSVYWVPDGHNLEITSSHQLGSNSNWLYIDGHWVHEGGDLDWPLYAGEGEPISGYGSINGRLSSNSNEQAITWNLIDSGEYTVPDDKQLVISSLVQIASEGTQYISINNIEIVYGDNSIPIYVNSSQTVSGSGIFNGYLQNINE